MIPDLTAISENSKESAQRDKKSIRKVSKYYENKKEST